MSARSTCLSPFCGARVERRLVRCPDCGRQMFGDDEISRRGWHVLQLGLILAGLMGAILWFWSPGIVNAIEGAPRTSFTGTAHQAWLMLFALGTLGLAGAAFVGTASMMILGRSSRLTTILAIALLGLGLLLIGAVLVSIYWK